MWAPSRARSARLLVPLLLYIGLVTAIISSLGAPLLPVIADRYHVALGQAQWTLTATVLVGAVTAPILGRLSDGPRRRQLMLSCLSGVVVGSVLVAVTRSFGLLVAGRALQGLGLGLVAPAMATARDHLPEHRTHAAIASLSIVAPVGVGLGYPLSAWLSEHGGLPAAFWLGAAVSGLALLLAVVILPDDSSKPKITINLVSAARMSTGLLFLLLACGEGSQWGWSSPQVLALLIAGAGLLISWARSEIHSSSPLINLGMLGNYHVRVANIANLVLGAATYMLTSAVTDFTETPTSAGFGFGASAITAGLLLVPSSALMLGAGRARAALIRRVPPLSLVAAGAVTCAAACAFFACWHSSLWTAFATMTVAGAGLGLTAATLPGLIVANVAPGEVGSALGLYTVVRYVGYSVGSAVSGAILSAYTSAGRHTPHERGFAVVLLAGCALSLIAAAIFGRTPPERQPRPR
jgi:predicted MFS family arabinose efflux permease